ncbi:hypothetical protein V6N11_023805 [Hibiscus sabdariffa]|uniref:Reverse transcriptase zinc-binding domain-containing protein n=1 Tax=Hibiscus sabdariffa TaxID=183260 RepID=A0ABR2TNV8_9ROSI
MGVEVCKPRQLSMTATLRRQLFDWELEQWSALLSLLSEFRSSSFEKDWVCWAGSGDGKFSVKSFYNNLFKNSLNGTNWTGLVWRGVAPPKVELFAWLVIRQRIPVRVELMRRGLSSISDILCPLCRNDMIFGKGRLNFQHLFFLARTRLALWFKAKHQNFLLSVESLMSDPSIADNLSLIGYAASCVFSLESSPSGFLKLNVDGAMLRNGRLGGVRGILRDCEGRCLATFFDDVGQGTPVLAELLALSYGLGFFFRSE